MLVIFRFISVKLNHVYHTYYRFAGSMFTEDWYLFCDFKLLTLTDSTIPMGLLQYCGFRSAFQEFRPTVEQTYFRSFLQSVIISVNLACHTNSVQAVK